MKNYILPPKVKITLDMPQRVQVPSQKVSGEHMKVVDGKIVTIHDDLNDNYLINIPLGATTFVYKGTLQSLYPEVGPSIIFIDAAGTPLSSFWATTSSIGNVVLDVPQGAVNVWAPVIKYNTTPVFSFRFTIDVTHDVINMNDLILYAKRDNTAGVIANFSLDIQFAIDTTAYTVIKDRFDTEGVRANMTLSIFDKAYQTDEYRKLVSNPLDFFTYTEHEYYLTIGALSSDIANVVKAKGGTNYDIPVSELSPEEWKYEDLDLTQFAKYVIASETPYKIPVLPAALSLPTPSGDNVYRVPGAGDHDIKGQTFASPLKSPFPLESSFFEAAEDVNLQVDAEIGATVTFWVPYIWYNGTIPVTTDPQGYKKTYIQIAKNIWDEENRQAASRVESYKVVKDEENKMYYITIELKLSLDRYPFNAMTRGDRLSLCFWMDFDKSKNTYAHDLTVTISKDSHLNISYDLNTSGLQNRPIQVIDPQKLMQKLLDLISGEQGLYTASILWKVSDVSKLKYRLVAAESIAKYANPYFHGNLKDLMHWLRTIGYEAQYQNGNSVVYVPRDNLYLKGELLDLTESEVADLEIAPATELLFSNIKVGGAKEDYGNAYLDGLEINATFEYTTGIIGKNNTLDFVSPYRIDAIGIQNLYRSFNSNQDIERQDANTDIFAVVLTPSGETYWDVPIEANDQLSETPIRLFNGLLSGPYIVKANESLFGISTDLLSFASTDGNKDATIGGVAINSDIVLNKKLFAPVLFTFKEGSRSFPDVGGALVSAALISFMWRGEKLRGYVRSISRMISEEAEREWELYAESL